MWSVWLFISDDTVTWFHSVPQLPKCRPLKVSLNLPEGATTPVFCVSPAQFHGLTLEHGYLISQVPYRLFCSSALLCESLSCLSLHIGDAVTFTSCVVLAGAGSPQFSWSCSGGPFGLCLIFHCRTAIILCYRPL